MTIDSLDITTSDILDLRNVSPQVEEYVCGQAYIPKYGQDNFQDNDILLDCYELVKEELQDIGIIFWDKENSVFCDYYTAKCIYYFRKLFDMYNFSMLLKQNKNILPHLEMIINNEEETDSNIHLVLEVLNDTFKDHPDIINCINFQSNVISNERFNAHIKAIIKTVEAIVTITINDITKITKYIQKINDGRKYVIDGVALALNNYDQTIINKYRLNLDYINNLLQNYDLDKTQPNEIEYYANFDKEDENEIDKSLRAMAKLYMDAHHRRIPHHIEYWLSNENHVLNNSAIVLLVAHHYEPDKPKTKFLDDIANMLSVGEVLLTKEFIDFINLLVDNILKNAEIYKE